MIENWLRRAGALTALGVAATLTATALGSVPAVSIKTSSHLIAYTQHVTVSGRLADRRSGVTVRLVAQRFGKHGFVTAAQTVTGRAGGYRFVVSPSLATSYRVTAPAGVSAATTVYVGGRVLASSCNLCVPNPPPGHQTLRVLLRYRVPGSAFQHELSKPLYFYYASRRGFVSKVHLVKTFPQAAARGDVVVASVKYPVVMGPGIVFHYVICLRDTESADGLGLPGHHHCGDPTLTQAEYDGYLG